nr:hypothetical protein OH820_11640 [Streptomyces sp. NBC_00857]
MRTAAPRARGEARYLLTGLTYCAKCRHKAGVTTIQRAPGVHENGAAYRCMGRARFGPSVCSSFFATRTAIEVEVRKWIKKYAADIDAAPASPIPTPRVSAREQAEQQRRQLEEDYKAAETAMTRLVVDSAKNPTKYPEAAFDAARDEIQGDLDRIMVELAEATEAASEPEVSDFVPVLVGLDEEWDTFTTPERNAILRQCARRIVIQRDGKSAPKVDVHPFWEPDPWA